MKSSDEKRKWLQDLISRTAPADKPVADFEKWHRDHRRAVEMLRSQGRQSDGARREMTSAGIWRAIIKSPRLSLAAAAVVLLGAGIAVVVLTGPRDIDKPGPTGIKSGAVDRGARTTYVSETDRIMEEATLIVRMKRMYADRDVNGLLMVLVKGSYDSKVLAAGYLGEIADARAIPALEKLASQSDEPDNPFSKAAARIRTWLETTTSTSRYGYFLFVRRAKGGPGTLVLAKVTSDGFELRDIHAMRNLGAFWEPLCVVQGRAYGIFIHSLLCIDLVTGESESLCSTLSSETAFDSERLYAMVNLPGQGAVLREFDFRKRAYRDVWGPGSGDWNSGPPLRISPDRRRIGFFASKSRSGHEKGEFDFSKAFRFMFVELETGNIIESDVYSPPPANSGISTFQGPAFVWIDSGDILTVRDHVLVAVNVFTGQSDAIVNLPGSPHSLLVRLVQEGPDARPLVVLGKSRYGIDFQAGTLAEDYGIGGQFQLHPVDKEQRLSHGERTLSQLAAPIGAKVSPDGQRALWMSRSRADELFFCDATEQIVRTVEQGWIADKLIWIEPRQLSRPPERQGALEDGWIAFADRPQAKPEPTEPDTRKNVTDLLALEVQTDKDAYCLHEPVLLTVTLTNISDSDVEVFYPEVFDERVMSISLRGPGFGRLVSQIASYYPEPAKIVIGPGQSVSATDALEVGRLGSFEIAARFKGLTNVGEWRGRLEASGVSFSVESCSEQAERELFKTKVTELLEKAREEFEADPNWDGMSKTLQKDVAAMGPDAAPYIIQWYNRYPEPIFRMLLGRPLVHVASPKALPFFEQRLRHGTAGERRMAAAGLYELYAAGRADDYALETLLGALRSDDVEIRREAAQQLAKIYDPTVGESFEQAIADPDQEVRETAARYLAAAEGLNLADWLDLTAREPTSVRYAAARCIIANLEETWHTTRGQFPEARWQQLLQESQTLEDFREVVLAWQGWAQENRQFSSRYFDADRRHWPRQRQGQ
ncbi:MAG: HEAT repeat domain-containing protein [Planctomycetota bacterium]